MISNRKAQRKKRGNDAQEDPSSAVVVAAANAQEITRNDDNQSVHPLVRCQSMLDNDFTINVLENSMNPKSLITGFYGKRGERLRHVVNEGALRLPQEALELLNNGVDPLVSGDFGSTKNTHYGRVPKCYELPPLDSVKRPSLDEKMSSIKVTTVSGEIVPGGTALSPGIQSVARNHVVTKKIKNVPESSIERIRGGGDDMSDEVSRNASFANEGADSSSDQSESQQNPTTSNMSFSATSVANNIPVSSVIETSSSVVQGTSLSVEHNTITLTTQDVGVSSVQPDFSGFPSIPDDDQMEPHLSENVSLVSSESKESSAQVAHSRIRMVAATSALPNSVPSLSEPQRIINESSIIMDSIGSNETKLEPSQPRVKPLKKRPAPQWEQHVPSANDEVLIDVYAKMPVASWFRRDRPSDIEMAVLSEWFDGSAPHRTSESYIESRNYMISMSQQLGHNRYITPTMARKAIPGDVGSVIRLHSFLTTFGLINEDAINDSAPTPYSFSSKTLKENARMSPSPDPWNDEKVYDSLLAAVVTQSNKKKNAAETAVPIIDWAEVAKDVGRGVLPSDCERRFLSLNIETVTAKSNDDDSFETFVTSSNTTNVMPDQKLAHSMMSRDTFTAKHSINPKSVQDIVGKCSNEVVSAVTTAALQTVSRSTCGDTDLYASLQQTQEAGILGLIVSQAANEARSQEDYVSRLLAEIVELRMQRLENRMALLDDVEGMIEAERVTLELERRDLYTARCRHWFGGT